MGTGWQSVPGELTQISAGRPGVWGVNSNDDVFYREGTYGDSSVVGCRWTYVQGKLVYVTSGSTGVIGVNRQNQIYRRTGINRDNPTGVCYNQRCFSCHGNYANYVNDVNVSMCSSVCASEE